METATAIQPQTESRTAFRKLRTDWRVFIEQGLGVKTLWAKQWEIIESVKRNRNTAVRTGHGVGKTHAAAIIAMTFLYCCAPAVVLATAPTWWQCQQIFWHEFKKIYGHSRTKLGGVMLDKLFKIGEGGWAGIRSTRDANFFQGVHAPNLLIIVDEAAGVPETIYEGVKTVSTGGNSRLLLIGNPTEATGSFHAAFSDPAFNCIHINCLDHPNIAEGREIIKGAVTREWIEERRAEWEHTPLWQARVLGEFPDVSEDQLIPLSLIVAAEDREIDLDGEAVIGVDIARFGSDETVIYVMENGAVLAERVLHGKNLMETTGHIKELAEIHGVKQIAVDDTGLGGGVTDRLREFKYNVHAINFGASPRDSGKYHDLPSELWGELRDGFKAGKVGPLPDDSDALKGQLAARRYTYRNCRLKVESKDDMKKRGLKSPDRADALALAWLANQHVMGLGKRAGAWLV